MATTATTAARRKQSFNGATDPAYTRLYALFSVVQTRLDGFISLFDSRLYTIADVTNNSGFLGREFNHALVDFIGKIGALAGNVFCHLCTMRLGALL